MEQLGILLKALDLDLALSAIVVIGLFVLALTTRWGDADPRVLRFLQADLFIFTAIFMFAGNLAYSFYMRQADPLVSIAHPATRLCYEILGIVGFDSHIAHTLRPQWVWGRTLAVILVINAVLVAVLFLVESHGWIS